MQAQALAGRLLETTIVRQPLHGDFHHDNVIDSARGWLAIDPKGLIGDPHYDLANVFRNPFGAAALARQPPRIAALADAFATALKLDRRRILQWAAAHSAISAVWDHAAGKSFEWDLTMTPLLLDAAEGLQGV